MCGIAGYWDWNFHTSTETLHSNILGMTQTLKDRGPDSGGLWIEKSSGMAFGHRRLSIRDLSVLGHQPMISPCGRFVLIYNGEIYNTSEIAADLSQKNIFPRGTSDTEILMLSLANFGVMKTLKNLMGMFVFALWDRKERVLTLARDRFGVKPLFWTKDKGNRFLFASELRAFHCADEWKPQINMDAVAIYLRFGYIPAPFSIWQDVYKLPQSHLLEINADRKLKIASYWDALEVSVAGLQNPLNISEEEAADELDSLLTDAVSRRMVSDVPLGSFLSGGIDSSLVTALMSKTSAKPLRTFCVGFEEKEYNEAPFAKDVAQYLQTEHTELYLPAKDALNLIPQLPEIYDEPFGDASAIPTILLCRLTRQFVTTVISGDGGDELFAGYNRYAHCLKNAPEYGSSGMLKKLAAKCLKSLSPHAWDVIAALLPKKIRQSNAGSRLHNYADMKLLGSFADYYQRYYMHYWWHPDTVLQKGKPQKTNADSPLLKKMISSRLAIMQYMDTNLYLADDILTKVDRASMSCGLEVRTPLLDHRVFAFAWRIPVSWRQKDGNGKYLLHKVLYRYLPKKLVDRPKMGFGIPIAQWLKGVLRDYAEDLLAESRLKKEGIFRAEPIRMAWQKQMDGISSWEYHLWVVLMFQIWLAFKMQKKSDWDHLPVVFG